MMVCALLQGRAQEEDLVPRFYLRCTVVDAATNAPLTPVDLYVVEEGKDKLEGTIRKKGRFSTDLYYGERYVYRFKHPKYHTVYIEVATTVPERNKFQYGEYALTVPMFPKTATNINPAAFNDHPVALLEFDTLSRSWRPDPHVMEAFRQSLLDPAALASDPAEPEPMEPEPVVEPVDSTTANIDPPGGTNPDGNPADPDNPEPAPSGELGRTGPVASPADPAEVEMATETMNYASERLQRDEEIRQNLETKRERERELLEIVAESEATSGPNQGRGKYFGATTTPDEIKIARYQQERAKQEREAEINRNQATKNERERELLLALAKADAQRMRDSLTLAGPASSTKVAPKVEEKVVEERFKTTHYHYVRFPDHEIVLRKVHYAWGQDYYFRGEREIDQSTYQQDITRYTRH